MTFYIRINTTQLAGGKRVRCGGAGANGRVIVVRAQTCALLWRGRKRARYCGAGANGRIIVETRHALSLQQQRT